MGDQLLKNPTLTTLIPPGILALGTTAAFLYLQKQIQELQAIMANDRGIMAGAIVEHNGNMAKLVNLETFKNFLMQYKTADQKKDEQIKNLEKRVKNLEKYIQEMSKYIQSISNDKGSEGKDNDNKVPVSLVDFTVKSKSKKKEREREKEEEDEEEDDDEEDVDYKSLWKNRKN